MLHRASRDLCGLQQQCDRLKAELTNQPAQLAVAPFKSAIESTIEKGVDQTVVLLQNLLSGMLVDARQLQEKLATTEAERDAALAEGSCEHPHEIQFSE